MALVQRHSRLRRRLLKAGVALPSVAWLGGWPVAVPATPACESGTATRPMTAGPFYTPSSPVKSNFRGDDPAGQPMALLADVVDTRCRPLPGAIVDLWHADSRGNYDNDGFRLRGRQECDGHGAVSFSTIRPGRYGWRTPHFHVRIFGRDGGRLLTTQLYFPGEAANREDGLYRPELEVELVQTGAVPEARFTFVVPTR